MINNQEYITIELEKTLEKMKNLTSKRLKNLIAITVGIIASKSVVLSDISEELKDNYTTASELVKLKDSLGSLLIISLMQNMYTITLLIIY